MHSMNFMFSESTYNFVRMTEALYIAVSKLLLLEIVY